MNDEPLDQIDAALAYLDHEIRVARERLNKLSTARRHLKAVVGSSDSARPTGRPRTYDYGRVTEVALDAVARGIPTGEAVAAAMGLRSAKAGTNLIAQARSAGFPIDCDPRGGFRQSVAESEEAPGAAL